MNGPQRVNLQDPVLKPRFSRERTGRKIAVVGLAMFILLVMITWLGFLGWGAVASLQWLLGFLKNLLLG
jgi:hypothetical protein